MTSPSTPYLAVDPAALDANIASMAARAAGLGIALRPHAKTHKCVEIARLQREADLRLGFAHAGEHAAARVAAGREYPAQLAAAHQIETRAEPRELPRTAVWFR